jgi:hypothetical protein
MERSIRVMTREPFVSSPSLQPHMPPASDDIDAVIRIVWGPYLTRELTWCGAGRLHDALCGLRDGLARPREARGRPG